jgi:hypothetical protein
MQLKLANPHQSAILTLLGLSGTALLVTMFTVGLSHQGLVDAALVWIGLIFFTLLSLMGVTIWALGMRQVYRARTFLKSERPLVRWTYSPSEWQAIKEAAWQETKGDWKLQGGCLAILLALAGLLTGAMLGLDSSLPEGIATAITGLVLGGLAGVLIGMLVAAGNFLGARQAYRRIEPGQVALGPDEIFASDDYFRGDGVNSYIREAILRSGRPATLDCVLVVPPRPRMPREEQWRIPIPAGWVETVEENLPQIAPHAQIIARK